MLKIKNNMLTAVLVVTTLPPAVPVSLELVDQICYTVGRASSEMNEVSRIRSGSPATPLILIFQLTGVATQCCRALTTAAVKGQVALQKGLGQMMPELVKCLGSIARNADNVKAGDVTYVTAEEVIRLLLALLDQTTDTNSESKGLYDVATTTYTRSVQETQIYMILLPTLTLLLDPENPSAIHQLGINHLLNLATQSPISFKDATASLNDSAKEKLETSIRQAVAARQNASKTTVRPQISLKSFE